MTLEEIPEEVVEALAKRGYTPDRILEMEPRQMFVEFCESNGLANWGDTLYEIAYDLIDLEVERINVTDPEIGQSARP